MSNSVVLQIPTRAALALLTLVGCAPQDGEAPRSPLGAASDSGELAAEPSPDAYDSGYDSGLDEPMALSIPELLWEGIRLDRKVRVIVEMERQSIPGLTQLKGVERQVQLAARAERYRTTRSAILSGIPSGVTIAREYQHLPLMTLEVTAEDALELLALDDRIVALHVDEVFQPFLTESLGLINQPEAEAAGHTGAGTAVAILDTGLDYTHSDFGTCSAPGDDGCQVVAVEDFADTDNSLDDNGHGTNVAAIVGGVAPGTDLIGLDVFRSNGLAYSSEVIAGIDWVIDNQSTYNIVALNMSLGGGQYSSECANTAYDLAMIDAKAAGVLSAVATGNNGWSNKIASPACAPTAVKVGAVYKTSYGSISWSSCSDSAPAADMVTCFSNSTSFIDLLAPGALISAGGYRMGGTSQATPHVAGALAVVAGAFPDETPDQWLAHLIDTGVDVTDSRNGYTHPRIDVEAAVLDAPAACTVTLGSTSASPDDAGESGTISITTGDTCDWSATSDSSWVTLTVSSGTGDGTLAWSASQNAGDARTATVTIDDQAITFSQGENGAPTGNVVVDGGSTYANSRVVALTIAGSDDNSGVSEMCIANSDGDSSTTCSSWMPYATSVSWQLSGGQGAKEVGVWFKDGRGRTSSMTTDSITLDTVTPTVGTPTGVATNGGAQVSWNAATDAGSNITRYTLVYTKDATAPSSCEEGTVAYQGSGRSLSLEGLDNDSLYRFRLCALDGAGNTGIGGRVTVRPSAEAGSPGTISIESGAEWTNGSLVGLTLASGIDSPTEMCVSNTSSCTSWSSVADTLSWTLPTGDGEQTVSLWHRNELGQESPVASDTIQVDSVMPDNGIVNATATKGQISLSWMGFSDDDSGISEMRVVGREGLRAPSDCSTGTLHYTGTGSSTTITGLTDGSTYAFRVCAVDAAGNISTGASASGTPAGVGDGPRGSIVVNGGDMWTNDRFVNVAISSSGATLMCVSRTSRCDKWETAQSAIRHRMGGRNGENYVFAWFRDADGNVSGTVSDTILLDTEGPIDGTVAAERGNGRVTLSWEGATDAGIGTESTIVVVAADSETAPRTCEDGTVAYEGTASQVTLSGLSNSQPYAYRICAVDELGNVSRGLTTVAWPGSDSTAPVGSFVLEHGADWTNQRRLSATFTLTEGESGLRDMCFSRRTSGCTEWTAWADRGTAAIPKRTGEHTIYAWVRDNQGNVSEMMSDSVFYDAVLPGGGVVTVGEGDEQVPVSWSDFVDRHSGVVSYTLSYVELGGRLRQCSDGNIVYEGTDTSATITGLTNGVEYTVGVCATDEAGNISRARKVTGRSASEYDAPTGSVVVDSGATYVGRRSVPVTLSAADVSGVAEMCVTSRTACTNWVDYATAAVVSFGSKVHGEETVKAWLKDGQGNVTETPLTDSVFVDGRRPVDGSVSASALPGGLRLSLSGFSDADSGVAEYRVTGRRDGRSPAACDRGRDLGKSTGSTIDVTGLSSDSTYKVRVCAVDATGNVSRGVVIKATTN